MALILDGTNGLSDVDGTAGTPAIRGSDANTGIFFPAADTIAFAEGGVESMRLDSAGNLLVGTASAGNGSRIYIRGSGTTSATASFEAANSAGATRLFVQDDGTTRFFGSAGSETARIDSSGNLLVGTTSNTGNGRVCIAATWPQNPLSIDVTSSNSTASVAQFFFNGSNVGLIVCSASSTSYNTSSDYRLKHDIQPMTGALAKVALLKPVTYKWNADDSEGEGFIAHELQEVCPSAVTGEKDAVDAEGKPVYQGIDTSFLVATLTAAIQELKAELDTVKAANESLTARIEALENQT